MEHLKPVDVVIIGGGWTYLYRAVDKVGRTIDFYLGEKRDITAAKHSSENP